MHDVPPHMVARMLTDPQREALLAVDCADEWMPAPEIADRRAGRALSDLSEQFGLFERHSKKRDGKRLFRPTDRARAVISILKENA